MAQAKANQNSRIDLIDSDGGVDWINASATSSDLYINLNDGFSSTIGRTHFLTIANATAIENFIGGDGNDYIVGNELNNTLYGMRGDDWINGGAGSDTVVFLDAASNYTVTTVGSRVRVVSLTDGSVDDLYNIEWLRFGGSDTMALSAADYIDLAAPVLMGFSPAANAQSVSINATLRFIFNEEIQIGSGSINIFQGNTLWRSVSVSSSEVMIQGNTLFLDLANTFAYDTSYTINFEAGVVSDLSGHATSALSSALNFKTELDIYTIMGTSAANTLLGTAADNRIFGLAGNDTLTDTLGGNDFLDGGLGSDRMAGGIGNDIYLVDAAGDVVTELANAGIDEVRSSVTHTLAANVENLTLLGILNINGTGNALSNVLQGNDGANILNGAAGADVLIGGLGNDTYVLDNIGDLVTESIDAGLDLVQSSVHVSALLTDDPQAALIGENVENITLTGSNAINATGNAQNNTINGNSAANILRGGLGNDQLNGGLGRDTLLGDGGLDIFIFNTALSASNIDTIQGFVTADDVIYLENAILRSLTTVGVLNANNFVTGTRAIDANDYVIYNNATGALLYDSDGSGNVAAVQVAVLVGVIGTVTANDFMVI